MNLIFRLFVVFLSTLSLMACASSGGDSDQDTQSEDTVYRYGYESVVNDLTSPWGFTFLPDGSLLITEKSGQLIHVKDGMKKVIQGLPDDLASIGQGGLLDIEPHPNYADNGWIYITYVSSDSGGGANTALMRLKLDGANITDKELLYKATPNTSSGRHFGSRIAFDNDGFVYFSVGDRGYRDDLPQDLTKDGGKIYRLNDDGSIPTDNPFINTENAKAAVYSYGHRNPQGMTKHPVTGEIWSHEHGPQGGDEINIIRKGKNYGWPLVTHGLNYDSTPITDKTEMEGVESSIHYWSPSIAPSGMAFVNSDKYKGLNGDLLVGSLKFRYLERCVIENNKVVKQENLLNKIGRVRSVEQGPDGFIYIGIENLGIVKLVEFEDN